MRARRDGRRRAPARGGMRICHVAPELLPVPPTRGGAIERWIRDAAVRLVGARPRSARRVARSRRRRDRVERRRRHAITSSRFRRDRSRAARRRWLRGLWYYSGVRRCSPRSAPDIVHHHSRPAGLVAAAERRGAVAVISLHSMDYGWGFGYRGWDRPLFTRGLRCGARACSCVSDFIRAPHDRALSVDRIEGDDGLQRRRRRHVHARRRRAPTDADRCCTSAASRSAKAFTCCSMHSSA